MKIVCDAEALADALGFLNEVVATRTTIPALNGVLIEVQEGVSLVRLTVNDLEFAACITVPCTTVHSGKGFVALKRLFSIVREISGDTLLETLKNDYVQVKAGSAKFKLVGTSADTAPQWIDISDQPFTELSAESFAMAIESVVFAAPKESGRYMLDGFLIENGDFVATDGARMAVFHASWAENIPRVLVPRRAASVLIKRLKEDTVLMYQSERHILFQSGNREFVCRRLTGNFPNYVSVVPKQETLPIRSTFEVLEFLKCLNRVAVFADQSEKDSFVRLEFSPEKIIFKAMSAGQGEAVDEMMAQGEGSLALGFNARFISEALNTRAGRATFFGSASDSPTLWQHSANYQIVMMPVRG